MALPCLFLWVWRVDEKEDGISKRNEIIQIDSSYKATKTLCTEYDLKHRNDDIRE